MSDATDAAGNEKIEDAAVAWCPVILWGTGSYGSTTIAIQKGDSILVGVTPFLWETKWVWEDDQEVAVSGVNDFLAKVVEAEVVLVAVLVHTGSAGSGRVPGKFTDFGRENGGASIPLTCIASVVTL